MHELTNYILNISYVRYDVSYVNELSDHSLILGLVHRKTTFITPNSVVLFYGNSRDLAIKFTSFFEKIKNIHLLGDTLIF